METTLKEYLDELEKRYQGNYNVEREKTITGKELDVYAISIIEHFRHVLTKKIQIDHYQEREIILVKGFEQYIKKEELDIFLKYLIHANKELVVPSFNIMSHEMNGIIVSSEGFSKEAIETARKFKYGKTFFLGIKGWCDIRLLMIDLKHRNVYCNSKGLEVKSVYAFHRFNRGNIHKGGDRVLKKE